MSDTGWGWFWVAVVAALPFIIVGIILLILTYHATKKLTKLLKSDRSTVKRSKYIYSVLSFIILLSGLIFLMHFGLAGGPNGSSTSQFQGNDYIEAQLGVALLLAGSIGRYFFFATNNLKM